VASARESVQGFARIGNAALECHGATRARWPFSWLPTAQRRWPARRSASTAACPSRAG